MTRIDFYIVDSEQLSSRALFACRLAEKAYSLKNQIYIYTSDKLQAKDFDELGCAAKHLSHLLITCRQPVHNINQEEDHIGLGDGRLRLGSHLGHEVVIRGEV